MIQGAAATVGVESIGVVLVKRWPAVWRNGVATIALIVILLIGHFGQMVLWASAFMAAGELETFAAAFYHSAVELHDPRLRRPRHVRPVAPARTVGSGERPLAFGWSTAAIVTIVIRLFRHRHLARRREESRGRSQETREPQADHQ